MNLRRKDFVGKPPMSGGPYLPGVDSFSIRNPQRLSLSAGTATVSVSIPSMLRSSTNLVVGWPVCLRMKPWTTSLSKTESYQWGWLGSSFNLIELELRVIDVGKLRT